MTLVGGPAAKEKVADQIPAKWPGICLLLLLVATDYKVRIREDGAAISGGLDVFVLIELGIYGAVFGFLVLTQPRFPRVTRVPAPLFWLGAYSLVAIVSLISSPYLGFAVARTAEMCVLFALVVAIYVRSTRLALVWFSHAFVALVALSVCFGLVVHFPERRLMAGRFTWLMLHPIVSGSFLAVALLICMTLMITAWRARQGAMWPRWIYPVALAPITYGLFATQTRGAIVGAAIGSVVLLWMALPVRGRVALFAVGTPLFLAGWLMFGDIVVSYLSRGEDARALSTLNSRTYLWALAWDEIVRNPLFGAGTSASRGVFLDQIGLGGGHNAVINVLVDYGVAGLIVWVGLLIAIVAAVVRIPRGRRDALLVDRTIILSVLVCLLVNSFFFEGLGALANVAGTFLYILAAWAAILVRERRVSEVATSNPVEQTWAAKRSVDVGR